MSAIQFLKWAIIIFIGLWIVWFFTGGPERGTSRGGIFIKPASPTGDLWKTYNKNKTTSSQSKEIKEGLEKAQEIAGVSSYKDKIIIKNGRASSDDPNREYLIIEASKKNVEKINITGWTIKSIVTGKTITIGKASYLPYTSKVNTEEPIFLRSGEKVFITTGRSPIGVSFKTNVCTGYFEQFQNFYPSLKRQCPRPEDEENFITTGPNRLNDDCIDYVERISRCTVVTKPLPLDIQHECGVYIANKINYNSCVENHKNSDENFYRPEWRIFLNREENLWKSRRETIKLLDSNDNLIDTLTY